MKQESLQLLSIARKARLIEAGEEPVGAACRSQHARLTLLAKDASPHTVRRVKSFVSGTKQPWIQLDCSKDDLGAAIGTSSCAIASITDVRLALAFAKTLEPRENYSELLADLEERSRRVDERRKEEKAHLSNKRNGKKMKTR